MTERDTQIGSIEDAILRLLGEGDPTQRDFVLAARDVLGLRGSMPDVAVDFYADVLKGRGVENSHDLASFLFDSLTAE